MEREIKFRAWDVTSSNLGMSDTFGLGAQVAEFNRDEEKLYKTVDFVNMDFMQYTGLKDKNGVEIYEGDIVVYQHPSEPFNTQPNDFIGFVEYVDCVASFRAVCDKQSFEEVIHQDIRLEVIGNIHQHKELLEE